MMIHPPMLYTGYVGFAIPFAFAMGALITRRTGADWIRATRRFALVAWTFLGAGILLGALWSYTELGWGGYWAWDPVENASLMPWLIGTAFLHSIMVQEKRGMLKVWNVSLICATFVLALLGTFLVRSGILDSIHAFGASTIGVQFLVFIALVVLGSVALIVWRLPDLRGRGRLDSLLSREAFFLLNNLVLVGLCLVIFVGHLLPAHLRGHHGHRGQRRAAVVQPAGHAARARAGAADRDRPDARLAPRHPALAAPRARWARSVRGGDARARRLHGRRRQPGRWPCSSFVAFVLAVVGRSSGAAPRPGAGSRASPWPRAMISWSGATGAATAATWCTRGSPCSSSGWPPRQRSSTSATSGSRPGEHHRTKGYDVTYVRPPRGSGATAPARARRSRSGRS